MTLQGGKEWTSTASSFLVAAQNDADTIDRSFSTLWPSLLDRLLLRLDSVSRPFVEI